MGERVSVAQTPVSYLPMLVRVAVTEQPSEHVLAVDVAIVVNGHSLPRFSREALVASALTLLDLILQQKG